MKNGRSKGSIFIVVTLVIAAIAATFTFVQIKDRTYFSSPPYTQIGSGGTDVLVVYYSRSGNTEALAREIARGFGADIVQIRADKYGLDFKGWRAANKDSSDDSSDRLYPDIEPEVIDLDQYSLVFLGSPIWWFSPAPPLWSFVENNDLTDKNIVLFNTFNSRFKQEKIEAFQIKIRAKGGHLIDHAFIRRGRLYNQKSDQELLEEARTLVSEKIKEWKAYQQSKQIRP